MEGRKLLSSHGRTADYLSGVLIFYLDYALKLSGDAMKPRNVGRLYGPRLGPRTMSQTLVRLPQQRSLPLVDLLPLDPITLNSPSTFNLLMSLLLLPLFLPLRICGIHVITIMKSSSKI